MGYNPHGLLKVELYPGVHSGKTGLNRAHSDAFLLHVLLPADTQSIYIVILT